MTQCHFPLAVTRSYTENDKQDLLDGLRAYNNAFIDTSTWGPLAVFCRDPQGTLLGGLIGSQKGVSLGKGKYCTLRLKSTTKPQRILGRSFKGI